MGKRSIVLIAAAMAFVGTQTMGCGSSGGGGSGGTTGGGGHGGTTGGGGNGGSSGGSFHTSIPSGTSVGSLTPAQQTQLCNDLGNYAQSLASAECQILAVFEAGLQASIDTTATDATLQAACSAAQSQCVASGTSSPDGGTCDFSNVNSTNCTATIGELTACANDQGTVLQQGLGSFPTCSNLTRATAVAALASDGGTSSAPPPASCNTFDTKCPGAANQTSTSPTGAVFKSSLLKKR
jgi:hypothetical protein